MKRISNILIIVLFLSVIYIGYVSARTAIPDDRDRFAYSISIIEYNHITKTEKTIGKPIMIHSKGFFNDRGFVNNNKPYPKTIGQLSNPNLTVGMIPFAPKSYNDDIKILKWPEFFGAPNHMPELFLVPTPHVSSEILKELGLNLGRYVENLTKYKRKPFIELPGYYSSENVNDSSSCYDVSKVDPGKIVYYIHYLTQNMDIHYAGNRDIFRYIEEDGSIVSLGNKFHEIIEEDIPSNISSEKEFLNNFIAKRGLKSACNSLRNFGVAISVDKIEKYYIKIESLELENGEEFKYPHDKKVIHTIEKKNDEKCKVSSIPRQGKPCDSVDAEYEGKCYQMTKAESEETLIFNTKDECNYICETKKCVQVEDFKFACKKKIPAEFKEVEGYAPRIKEGTGLTGMYNTFILYKRIKYGYTNVVPTRYKSNKYHSMRAGNSIIEEKNSFCIRDNSDRCIPGKFEHYIGPNPNEAIVGTNPKNNKYVFNDFYGIGGRKTIGTRYYYFVCRTGDPGCEIKTPEKEQCRELCGNNTGLACAEKYCDSVSSTSTELKGTPRERKKNCIINTCNYKENKNPINTSQNSIKNNNTTCGIDQNSNRKFSGSYNVLDYQYINEFSKGKKNTPFDMRKYIIVECKNDSSVEINMKPGTYLQGSPIENQSLLTTDTKCTFRFDYQQWTFDFATVHSKDIENRRKLLYIFNTFNNLQNIDTPSKIRDYTTGVSYYVNGYKKTNITTETMPFEDLDFAKRYGKDDYNLFGKVDYSKYFGKVLSDTSHTQNETIFGKKVVTVNDKKAYQETSKDSKISVTTIYSPDKVKLTMNNRQVELNVNRYNAFNQYTINYLPATKCVKLNGNGTWIYTDSGNNCSLDRKKSNDFFVNYNATPSSDYHNIITNLKVKYNGNNNFLNVNDKCSYSVMKSRGMDEGICEVSIEPIGNAKMDHERLLNGKFKVVINVINRDFKKTIDKYSLDFSNTYSNLESNINMFDLNPKYGKYALTDIKAKVTYKDGKSFSCNKKIEVIPQGNCSLVVEKGQKENNYRINTTLTGWTKNIVVNSNGKLTNFTDSVTLRKDNNENLRVEGIIERNGEKRSCGRDGIDFGTCFSSIPRNERANQETINKYCEINYKNDMAGFESEIVCRRRCGICYDTLNGDDEMDTVIKNYCENSREYGFKSNNDCYNRCHRVPSTAVFRQISNLDPFPYSVNSPKSFLSNSARTYRPIGSNWIKFYKYITEDNEDHTSITGAYAGTKVEYVVDLTPKTMQMIRNDNYRRNYKYTDYDRRKNDKVTGPFYSRFIHENPNTSVLFSVKNDPIVIGG